MRLLVYYPQRLPYPTGIGGAVVTWALVKSAVERGHNVTVVSQRNDQDRMQEKSTDELQKLGVSVRLIQPANATSTDAASKMSSRFSFLRRALWPRPEDFYANEIKIAPALEAIIREVNPDAIYLYPVEATVTTNRISSLPPRLAVQVNLGGTSYRRALTPTTTLRQKLTDWSISFSERKWDQYIAEELKSCEVVISHAAHSAEWLRQNGVPQCRYLSNPVVDAVGDRWQELREDHEARVSVPKLLVVGSVAGTPQRASLKFLTEGLLDEMAKRLAPNSYEVHIVGGGKLKPDVAKLLDRPEVKIRGYVDDIAAEFLSSTLLLVPTPIDLGARTRIVEGFSFGCCVVTHTCDQKGMPEIEHNRNALVGETAPEIADLVRKSLQDVELRKRLGLGARKTYESELSADVVCGRMLDQLENLSTNAGRGVHNAAKSTVGAKTAGEKGNSASLGTVRVN